ncbi:MAG: CoA pyrophosphatase [Saprospiraceae bacterium]|nr:CoA pyrophosphatase [Saprospiraceae bacterium]
MPGQEAHKAMAAYAHGGKLFDAPETARKAGVFVLLFEKNDGWHVLLTERTSSNPNDRHSGQISFPGGQFEASDESLLQCALRETHEEVGISPDKIEVIGALTTLYIPVSNFHVFPFLGWTATPPQYFLQKNEVKTVIEAPISLLQQPETVRITPIKVTNQFVLKEVPCFDVFGKIVWGATAMMLNEVLALTR